ncbi:hypothetical protein EYS14_08080 [Alteromonadaceae bacterium M269]|nr:hypothetical protein EYS14_08080 [Alteromonadaceae bacterium M269]
MGISIHQAKAIVKLFNKSNISGRIFSAGRQTIQISRDRAIEVTAAKTCSDNLNIDEDTRAAKVQTDEKGERFISDRSFFSLIHDEPLESFDVTDYEGASILLDLNYPIASEHHNVAGFILDGSTLDNVFNPAQALLNMVSMLDEGGVLYSLNVASLHYQPYSVVLPAMIYDFFVYNEFEEFEVYLYVYREWYDTGKRSKNVFAIDPEELLRTYSYDDKLRHGFVPILKTNHASDVIGISFYAKKNASNIENKYVFPVQAQYRNDEHRKLYRDNLQKVSKSSLDLHQSTDAQFIKSPIGYRFIEPK